MSLVALILAGVSLVFSFSLFALLLVSRAREAEPAVDGDGGRPFMTQKEISRVSNISPDGPSNPEKPESGIRS